MGQGGGPRPAQPGHSGLPALTSHESMLLWLGEAGDEEAGAFQRTQAGIAHGVGLHRAHVSRTAARLLEGGLVAKQRVALPGLTRSVVGYRLTPAGRARLGDLRALLLGAEVEARKGGDARRMPLAEALRLGPDPAGLLAALQAVRQEGLLDLDAAAPLGPRNGLLQDLGEAPARGWFVGREEELRAVRRWLASNKPLLLVEGWAGMGKTTLVAHALRSAAPRSNVLWVRVKPWSTGHGLLGQVRQFLRPSARPDPPAATAGGPEAAAALRSWLGGVPLLLVVDDLHRATPSVQQAVTTLRDVAERNLGLRLILVGRQVRFRAPPPLHDALKVPPLSDGEARQLLQRLCVAAADHARLAAAARGNPLFLELLSRSPPSASRGGPLADYLFEDLATALPEAQWNLLKVVAALRLPVSLEFLEGLGHGSPHALSSLVDAGLLGRREDGKVEMHDLVREAVYSLVGFAERRQVHALLAQAFEAEGGWLATLERLHQLVRAGRRDEAVRWVMRHQAQLLLLSREPAAPPAAP